MIQHVIWAVALGAISAVSLPLGSIVGIWAKPRRSVISTLAAFGAGALIAALAVELVAPTLFAMDASEADGTHGDPRTNLIALIIGLAMGGILFTVLDRLVNSHGGFLRRTSSTISYLTARQRNRGRAVIADLASFILLRNLPPAHINQLVGMVRPIRFKSGEMVAEEGSTGKQLLFIVEGRVAAETKSGLKSTFGAGSVVGIMPLITGRPLPATVTAETDVNGYSLSAADFHRLSEDSSEFSAAVCELAGERLELIVNLMARQDEKVVEWLKKSRQALATQARIPDALEWRKVRDEHKSAPLAIWLGILLDGIPESFVIGAGLLVHLLANPARIDSLTFADVVPYTLIAGLFLSNFPEAMASSANMRMQGFGKMRVFLCWFSLLVITAIGAGAGFLLADSVSHAFVVFAEGLAAGAMLTMIAGAMIPEAVHLGRASVVGLSTLGGFLAAIAFKLLE